MGNWIPKLRLMAFFVLAGVLWGYTGINTQAEEPVIVVIDPGHGGNNLGAEYEEYTEKDMNLIVAQAMKEELEKYENVIVYLTHEQDISMSIKDRALFAKEKNADFLVCLHFNSSVNHNLYGAEVWVPAFGDYYVMGRQFAEISMDILTDMGLFSRGIKTRLNDSGDNYYGILRYCTQLGIPSALIEHCHLDQETDKPFYQQSEEQWKEFGRKDAEAVAKYFGLRSAELGVDYSDYPKKEIPYGEVVKPDKTQPEICEIEILTVDEESGEVTVSIKAEDSDSYIQYYSYSLNGGNTYSDLLGWPRPTWDSSQPEYVFTVQVPFDVEIELRAMAYNGFDVFTESNIVILPAIAAPAPSEEPKKEEEDAVRVEEILPEIIYDPDDIPPMSQQERLQLVVLILIISLVMAVILYAMVRMLFKLKGHNKKHR